MLKHDCKVDSLKHLLLTHFSNPYFRKEISKTNNIKTGEVRIIFAGKELHDHQKLKVPCYDI